MIFILILFVVGLYLYKMTVKPKNYPPGPNWLPFIGCSNEFKSLCRRFGGVHVALSALSMKHKTNIVGLKLGNDMMVAVLSFPLVREVLRSDDYIYRPNSFFMKLRSMGTRKGITGTDGQLWNIQRNFLVRHLRNVGFGKKTMDMMIMEELKEILVILNDDNGEEHKMSQTTIGLVLAPAVLSILWALTSGNRIERNDPRLQRLLQLFHKRSKAFDISGGVLSQYPWFRYVMPERSGYNLIRELNADLKAFFMETINEHSANWYEGREDDVIYSFITEMKKNEDPSFTFDQLVMVCLDIFVAGAQTTSNTIDFAILAMILHPHVQEKVQAHLDDVFKTNEAIDYHQRHLVPYVEAVINEVMRIYPIVPVTGPRRIIENVQLGEYTLPKDTTILLSNYSMNFDPNLWNEPDEFKPERFLDGNGQIINFEHFMPFNIGKRKCLGDALAKGCIFTFFCGILRNFKITLAENSPPLTGKPLPGITLTPERYIAQFKKRL